MERLARNGRMARRPFAVSFACSEAIGGFFDGRRSMQLRCNHALASRRTIQDSHCLSLLVIACHCLDCQRRTGAPFGVGAYYPADVVTISGTSKEFTHAAASGGKIQNYFCPQCCSTVYWKLSNFPALIGVAVGAMANPKYPTPVRSVEEQTKHDWVQIDGAVEHFRQSSLPKIQTETPPWRCPCG